MPTIILATGDLDGLLEALDAADDAVRRIYRKLADDPDLAVEHETVLRELHRRRTELSRQVGMVALAGWRAARTVVAGEDAAATSIVEPVTPAPPDAAETNGVLTATMCESLPPPAPVPAAPDSAAPSVFAAPVIPTPHASTPDLPSPLSAPISPASDAQVAAFKSAVLSKGLGATAMSPPTATPSPVRPWPVTLHELMCLLGPRETHLDDAAALADELDALAEVATHERQLAWVRFPIEVQKHWLSHLVARTRSMRDHPVSETVFDRLKKVRTVYPQWAREYVPGHINGLQLKHAPVSDTWATDADDHWRALCAVVAHEVPQARKSPPTRKKRERPVVEDEPPVVDPDWPLLPVVRGKTAVIVGGAPKEPNRDRLETYLRLATLEWPLVDGPRKVEAVAQRISKGAYDLVIVNQALISHPEAERILDAAKASRIRWAIVDGYGSMAVRLGIERFLRSPRDEAVRGR
jgi:hypothetical protein